MKTIKRLTRIVGIIPTLAGLLMAFCSNLSAAETVLRDGLDNFSVVLNHSPNLSA